MVIHLAVQKENQWGGYTTDTLCGQSNKAYRGDACNDTDDVSKVTYKKCGAILVHPEHWRHRKWLK